MKIKENIIINKSKIFAIDAIKMYQLLKQEKREFVLSQQFLKSATSIGANIAEATNSISKKEFISKLNISLKEAHETKYWLELLVETDYISKEQFNIFNLKCIELIRLLTAIIKTSVANLNIKKY